MRWGDVAPGGGPATCSGDTGEPSVGAAGYVGEWAAPLLHAPLLLPRLGAFGGRGRTQGPGCPCSKEAASGPLLPACKQGSPSIHFRVLCPLVPPEKP